MSFAEIERVIGTKLPRSAARHRAWWSNNPMNNVATKEWLDAGYETEQVDIEHGKLVFKRISPSQVADGPGPSWEGSRGGVAVLAEPVRHPLFGAHKGLIRITPGTDLTEPADPEWGKLVG